MRGMFRTVAPRYDFITRAFSYGMDKGWKRLGVARARLPEGALVLDLASGTGDFSLLVRHFVAQANAEEGANVQVPHGETLHAMECAFGQGSIRVLENAVRRIVLARRQGRVSLEDLCEAGIVPSCEASAAVESHFHERGDSTELSVRLKRRTPLKTIMRSVEKAVLNSALRRHHGHVAPAMNELQVTKEVWYRARGS